MCQEYFLALSNAKEHCVRNPWSLVNKDIHGEGERVIPQRVARQNPRHTSGHKRSATIMRRQSCAISSLVIRDVFPKVTFTYGEETKTWGWSIGWCAGSRARRSCSGSTVSHSRWLLSELDSSGLPCHVRSWEAAIVIQPQHFSKLGRNGEGHTDLFQSLRSLSYKSWPTFNWCLPS